MEIHRQQEPLAEYQERTDDRRLIRQLEGLDPEELEEQELSSSTSARTPRARDQMAKVLLDNSWLAWRLSIAIVLIS